jgi:uncharacterized protein (DUF362 family)
VVHSGASTARGYEAAVIRQVIRQALVDLTGAPDHVAAWRKLVQPGDVVGLKINPNGNEQIRSSQPFFAEILDGLLEVGIRREDLFVYERYRELLEPVSGWFPSWVKLVSAAPGYDDVQQNISGYDPDTWVDFDGVLPKQDPNDVVARRSHAALFLSRTVTKVINCCVLKTHQASGVTLALKNLSHGFFNNANRSHPTPSDNRIASYIPAIVSHPLVRSKVVLNICDGIHGLYHGGPYGDERYVWRNQTVYVSTDPVALDKIGWRVIDEKRTSAGLRPVVLSPRDPPQFNFDQTKPQHIDVAGELGLGEYRPEHIDFNRRVLA